MFKQNQKTVKKSVAKPDKDVSRKIIGLDELFKSTIKDYKANWQKFAWLLILPVTLALVVKFVLYVTDIYFDKIPVFISLPLVILCLAAMIYFSVLYVWAYIAEVRLAGDLTQKVEGNNIWKYYHDSRPQFWRVVAVTVAYTILAVIFSICLIVPGVIFMVAYCFSIYFVVYENAGFEGAFGSSRALVKDYWWAVFGRVVAGGFAACIVYLLISIILSLAKSIVEAAFNFKFSPDAIDWMSNVLSMFGSLLLSPLALIYMVKIFKSLQEVKK